MVSSYRLGQFSQACTSLEIKHHRTRPYTPRTNGEAERFIQTVLREWTYANHWADSGERDAHLQPWIDYYNRDRPHRSLNYKPPISRSDYGTTTRSITGSPRKTVAKSLEGDCRPEHLFALRQSLAAYRIYKQRMAEIDFELAQKMREPGILVQSDAISC
jgi:Integrase core domain